LPWEATGQVRCGGGKQLGHYRWWGACCTTTLVLATSSRLFPCFRPSAAASLAAGIAHERLPVEGGEDAIRKTFDRFVARLAVSVRGR